MGISPRQLEAMQQRLAGRKPAGRRPDPVPGGPGVAEEPARVILGVDPSLRGTGLGVVELTPEGPVCRHFEVLRCPAGWSRTQCLLRIAEGTRDVLGRFGPEACAVEGLFHARNVRTALIMGEARGACLAMVAAAGLAVYELAPRKVKQAIVGYGGAGKEAVARMVQRMLGLAEAPPPDAADALALALAFAQEQKRLARSGPQRL
ncbi:MAG: crossover junction endodeoxyribonuclease RuvC [Verrucomicrobia bacterium]|nr:MAG: crossover junction endodeoxyribonuclease RuvC [Verrucomicrobiota bacterium]